MAQFLNCNGKFPSGGTNLRFQQLVKNPFFRTDLTSAGSLGNENNNIVNWGGYTDKGRLRLERNGFLELNAVSTYNNQVSVPISTNGESTYLTYIQTNFETKPQCKSSNYISLGNTTGTSVVSYESGEINKRIGKTRNIVNIAKPAEGHNHLGYRLCPGNTNNVNLWYEITKFQVINLTALFGGNDKIPSTISAVLEAIGFSSSFPENLPIFDYTPSLVNLTRTSSGNLDYASGQSTLSIGEAQTPADYQMINGIRAFPSTGPSGVTYGKVDAATNDGLDRSATFSYTTTDGIVTRTLTVNQEGQRQEFLVGEKSTRFTGLEYVKTTGTQYIATDWEPGINAGIEVWLRKENIKTTMPNPVGNAFFSVSPSATESMPYTFQINLDASLSRSNGYYFYNNIGYNLLGNTRTYSVVTDIFDGSSPVNMCLTRTDAHLGDDIIVRLPLREGASTNRTLVLFANASKQPYNRSDLCVYRVTCSNDGTVERDFVPVRDNTSGKIGFHELKRDAFYPSSSSTAFEAGPVSSGETFKVGNTEFAVVK